LTTFIRNRDFEYKEDYKTADDTTLKSPGEESYNRAL